MESHCEVKTGRAGYQDVFVTICSGHRGSKVPFSTVGKVSAAHLHSGLDDVDLQSSGEHIEQYTSFEFLDEFLDEMGLAIMCISLARSRYKCTSGDKETTWCMRRLNNAKQNLKARDTMSEGRLEKRTPMRLTEDGMRTVPL